ncbi:type II toxin-antitoxin system prevent-host-death family antitoxin [soil metagenome]
MAITKISSRDFNQDVGRAKRAAAKGPVVILNRGKPAHVLLSIEEYDRLTKGAANIVELLSDERAAEVAFEVERREGSTLQIPNFSE